jgi:FAD/FMN-containing dehydrogenase
VTSTSPSPFFNLAVPHRPGRVHAVTPYDDLGALVAEAARAGERLHVVGAGHGFATPIESGTALLTSGLGGVEVDPVARTARVGAGSRWSDVLEAAVPHGLAPVCGSAPGVGVVGFLLGGGISPVGRTVGWGSDHVRSFDLLSAGGRSVRATPRDHADLFWALRGGDVAPGIVTQVEIDLLPITTLYGGGLYFAADDAGVVLDGYARWAASAPEAATSSCALLRLPDLDLVPEPLRGRFVVHVRVAVVGHDDPAGVVAPLRELATPVIDAVGEMPYAGIGAVHADPVDPMPVLEGGLLLTGFDAAAAADLLTVAGPQTQAPFTVVEVRQLGGALARPPAVPDAVIGRDAAFSLFVVSAPVPPLFDEVVPAAAAGLFEAMSSRSAGGPQPNFVGALNTVEQVSGLRDAADLARLHDVWRTYDPAGVFTGLAQQ